MSTTAGTAGRPVIGITAYAAKASWGAWHTLATVLPERYVTMVARAGGAPIVLPVSTDAAAVAARLDGLVLSGGPDVDPARYGEEPHELTDPADERRDSAQLAVFEEAGRAGLPVLAICRGLQLVNVARGGTLHQHLPDVIGSEAHRPEMGMFARIGVDVEADSRLHAVLRDEGPIVACHHHQAVATIGKGLVAAARSVDGVIEALESDDGAPLLAVQWHPEQGEELALFSWLVEEARAVATRRDGER